MYPDFPQAIEEDGCQENCRVTGTYLLHELAKLRDEFSIVGDVRGKGLMVGVEMVSDKVRVVVSVVLVLTIRVI